MSLHVTRNYLMVSEGKEIISEGCYEMKTMYSVTKLYWFCISKYEHVIILKCPVPVIHRTATENANRQNNRSTSADADAERLVRSSDSRLTLVESFPSECLELERTHEWFTFSAPSF